MLFRIISFIYNSCANISGSTMIIYWTGLTLLLCTLISITNGYSNGNLKIYIKTGDQLQGETEDDVFITIYGIKGTIEKAKVNVSFDPRFQDTFELNSTIGTPSSVMLHKVGFDNWYLDYVSISLSGKHYKFTCQCWFNRTSNSGTQAIRIQNICENLLGTISCAGIGQGTITVMNGMYGRSDWNTCPHQSINQINCYQNGAKRKIMAQCESKTSCRFQPNEAMFYGDPCITTLKYATVAFDCGDDGWVPTMKTEKLNSTSDLMDNRSMCCGDMYSCNCTCYPRSYEYDGCLLVDIECVIAILRKQLIVDVETLSSFTRKKTSATDLRTSPRMIGSVGVLIIVAVVSVIVIPDTFRLCWSIRKTIKQNNLL